MIWMILFTYALASPNDLECVECFEEDALVQSVSSESNKEKLSDFDIFTSILEEKDPLNTDSSPIYQWQNLRFPSTPVAAASLGKSLFLIDVQDRVWELRSTGRWQISLDLSESSQTDQEDLLLDAQSSFEEFLEQEDLDSISEDDLLDDSEDQVQTVVQSIEDELESAIFDPLRQEEKLQSKPFLQKILLGDGILACMDGTCFQYDGNDWFDIEIPHVLDTESRYIDGKHEVYAVTVDGMYVQENHGKWQQIPTAPQCTNIEQKRVEVDDEQVSSIFFAHCDNAIYISMDGRFWARKSEINGQQFTFVHTNNFPDSLLVLDEGIIWISKDLGQTFSNLSALSIDPPSTKHQMMDFLFPITQQIQDSDEFGFFDDHDVIGLGNYLYGIRSLDISKMLSPSYFSQESYFYFDSINGFFTMVGPQGVYQYLPKIDMKQNIQDMNVLDLESALEMATRELRVQLEMTQFQNSLLRSMQLPVLALEVGKDNNRTIAADYGAISSFAQINNAWYITLGLCFGGCGNTASSDMSGFTEELIVVDGQIYPGTEIGMTPAVSGLSASLNKDIRSKSNQVTDIYDALQRVMQYEQVGNISLYESVQRDLERQELIAFLQYLTNSNFFLSEE